MKSTSSRKISLIIFIGSILILLSCQDPPLSTLESAKVALKDAAEAGAIRYAEPTYRQAESMVNSGWMELARQKGRLAPFRNYHAADSILHLSIRTSHEAVRLTLDYKRSVDSLSRAERDGLRKEIGNWRDALDGSLENFRAERYWSAADMALRTGNTLIAKGEYESARDAISRGRDSLRKLEDIVEEYANEAAQKIHTWRRWVQETVSTSNAKGTYAIIVDKSAHKTYLVYNGKLARTYDCELGYNSARQKLFAGDGATPEGLYRVTKIKYNSKYYRAFLINYPNEVDLKRFRENKSKGIISRYARVGALIEIHGDGGKKRDWTEGCVALTNDAMDYLMQHVSVGTPVTIVRRSDQWP